MANLNMSEKKYMLLSKYDCLLTSCMNNHMKYYLFFLFFYRDYFVHKMINKLMRNGSKEMALYIFRKCLFFLKGFFGFQPFFLFKHISFSMSQLFKMQKKLIRKSKSYYLPLLLSPHNQVTYSVTHMLQSAKQMAKEEKKALSYALSMVLLNSFISVL